MNNLQQEIIIKAFREKFVETNCYEHRCVDKEKCVHIHAVGLDQFIAESLEAVRQDTKEETANDICNITDDIELSYRNTSLEEWKAFKHIRNAIRDKYVLKEEKKR